MIGSFYLGGILSQHSSYSLFLYLVYVKSL